MSVEIGRCGECGGGGGTARYGARYSYRGNANWLVAELPCPKCDGLGYWSIGYRYPDRFSTASEEIRQRQWEIGRVKEKDREEAREWCEERRRKAEEDRESARMARDAERAKQREDVEGVRNERKKADIIEAIDHMILFDLKDVDVIMPGGHGGDIEPLTIDELRMIRKELCRQVLSWRMRQVYLRAARPPGAPRAPMARREVWHRPDPEPTAAELEAVAAKRARREAYRQECSRKGKVDYARRMAALAAGK